MRNIYYLIWAESIQSIRKFQPNNKNWKFTIFFVITAMNAFNYATIIIWLKYLNILIIPHVDIVFFPGYMINSFFEFIINFASPFIILNYILIIRNDRYKKIVKKYTHLNKRYGYIYSMITLIAIFLSAILYGILTGTIFGLI